MERRTFLGSLLALLGLGRPAKAETPPPEVLPSVPAPPPETKADPGWGPTHVHEWIEYPTSEIADTVQICSHSECYSYKVFRQDPSTGTADVQVHEYAPNEMLSPPVIFRHTDWWEMTEHIVAYIDKTGGSLLSSDDPMRRTIGFCAPDEVQWEIPLTRIRASLAQDERSALVSTYLTSPEGRVKLAAAMEGAGRARRRQRLGITS